MEQMRRDFVANVSHEFKTPLTTIQGFAEILLDGGLEDTQNSRRFLEFIHEYAVDLARLTDDLLDLSLIETGKLQMSLAPVRVAELIRSCANLLRFKAQAKQINLQVDCAPDLPPVRGDTQRLGQVVKNLLNNAVQYTPPGGGVTVHSALADGQVMIAISDTGIGIPRAEQERIFERFYRVDSGRAREGGGTGLGPLDRQALGRGPGGANHGRQRSRPRDDLLRFPPAHLATPCQ